jgi:aldose 1-epimerase
MRDAIMPVTRDLFGILPDGRAVERLVLRDITGFEAHIMTYGAALQALWVPDARGSCDDVVLGHDDLQGYFDTRGFFGATVGRYANRIANARFVLEGEAVQLAANDGPHALHGELDGFDRRLWQISDIEDGAAPGVTLVYSSADGEEGYPGRLDVRVSYRLTGPSELSVSFAAWADRPTIVNLTNHSFFNLDGASSDADVLDHRLTLAADRFLAIDPNAIPLPGPPRTVAGTPFDFCNPSAIGARIRHDDTQLRHGRGYDHNFCLDGAGEVRFAARLEAPRSGRILELLTDQPGLQVYSGNYLDGSIMGKRARCTGNRMQSALNRRSGTMRRTGRIFRTRVLCRAYRHHSVYRFFSASLVQSNHRMTTETP